MKSPTTKAPFKPPSAKSPTLWRRATTVQTQLAANQALVKAGQQTYQLTDASFRSGVDSALDVAAAQQSLDSARQNLIQSQYSRLFSLINLYQALGGGWEEHTTPSRPSAK